MNIVIIHNGFAKYLVYALKKIKETNKSSNVFLISDNNYKEYSKYSTFVNINDVIKDDAKLFKSKYIHLGKSNLNYEMFCMQRWIILRDFMKEYSINECFNMDSDILIYSDLDEALIPFNNYKISLSHNLGLSMYIKDINVLDEFSKFLLFKYTNENEINKLKEMYYNTNRINNGVAGSISDMDISREFFSKFNEEVGNLSEVNDNSIFDSAIVYGDPEFEMIEIGKYKFKNIFFENNIPFCNYYENDIKKKVKFHSLHFITFYNFY